MARDRRPDRQIRAVEWDVRKVETERQAELLANQVSRGSNSSARSVVVFSRIGLDERNQELHRPRRHQRVYGKQYRCAGGERDPVQGLERPMEERSARGWIEEAR